MGGMKAAYVAAVIGAVAVGAWVVAGRSEAPDRPLEVSPEVSNLGTVHRLGGVVTTAVEVRNPGARDLTVKSITTS